MKKIKIILIVIVCVIIFNMLPNLLFVFLSDLYYNNSEDSKYYTEDIKEYKSITSEEYMGKFQSYLPIFPEDVDEAKVEKFMFEYNFDDGLSSQLYLECTYEEEKFNEELKRLSYERFWYDQAKYDEENFNYPAYVLSLCYESISEYALIDYDNYKIIYIYIGKIPKDKILFDKNYLPKGYSKKGDYCDNMYQQ